MSRQPTLTLSKAKGVEGGIPLSLKGDSLLPPFSMTWEEFRERVRSELGEALFTRPDETLNFVMKSWRELMPEKFENPLRLSETDTTPADFAVVTQQFLWQVLDNDADTAAMLLWLTLTEWLAGWQAAEATSK